MKGIIKMKKAITIVMSIIFVLSLGVYAFAAPGAFLESPSRNPAPTLIDAILPEDCTAEIIITSYADRASMSDDKIAAIEGAYKVLRESDDITALNQQLKDYIKDKGIESKNLAVSDLFDISYYGCNVHDYHKQFTFTIKADTLKNFVGLLHFHNGEWDFIENAKLNDDGTITFTVEDFSPFAIIVDTGAADAPTGDVTPWIFIALIVASATALTVVAYNYKKEKAKA